MPTKSKVLAALVSTGLLAAPALANKPANEETADQADIRLKADELAPEIIPLIASEEFPSLKAGDRVLRVTYGVYVGGLFLASIDLETGLSPNEFEAEAFIKTEGLADALIETTATIASEGRVDGSAIASKTYNSDIIDRKKRQLVSLEFVNGKPQTPNSFPEYDLKKRPVSNFEKRNTIDPLSAILSIMKGINASPQSPCGKKTKVFDGRRRFDLSMEFIENENVSSGKEGAYDGPAVKCWLGYKKIAGYKPYKDKLQKWKKSDWPDIYMWLAPMKEDEIHVPVRFFADTEYGAIVARATRLEVMSAEKYAETAWTRTSLGEIAPSEE